MEILFDLFDLLVQMHHLSLKCRVQRSVALLFPWLQKCFRTKDLAQALKQVMASWISYGLVAFKQLHRQEALCKPFKVLQFRRQLRAAAPSIEALYKSQCSWETKYFGNQPIVGNSSREWQHWPGIEVRLAGRCHWTGKTTRRGRDERMFRDGRLPSTELYSM